MPRSLLYVSVCLSTLHDVLNLH
ncbi:uncharacterized protein CELE_T12G3.11 [Caenorhabditis elegans]|uniref:Uncharacterized protein n=1 Tax=Caenorhabditis elegans TaxID=6239 RepID=U4PFB8_CAEEL|nr:Uncharacterized protein CELE_T12G3.11 [Caenorhabditis elegans]CDH93437.1 Uncharacterized protein CELE_T12G3.11 [Caenorhabditis elegans]|eukprot:NP_001294630.1 Uncharacterized protein CELE_T12G3.11 [Caenorhabditis elegans]